MNYLFPLIAQEHYQVVKSISRGRPEPMKKQFNQMQQPISVKKNRLL